MISENTQLVTEIAKVLTISDKLFGKKKFKNGIFTYV